MSDALQITFDNDYEAAKEAAAEKAYANIKRGAVWEEWLAIAEWFVIGRNKAMARAATNEPLGAKYNRAYSEWLNARKWAMDIDKASRAHAIWCADHLPELEHLRSLMSQNEREKINHPTSMRRYWERKQREGEKSPAEQKKEPRAKVLERELEATAAERDKWKHKAEKDGSLFDVKKDTAKQIAMTLRHNVTTYKLQELHKAIGDELRAAKAAQKHAG